MLSLGDPLDRQKRNNVLLKAAKSVESEAILNQRARLYQYVAVRYENRSAF